jgi:hypothetical protein
MRTFSRFASAAALGVLTLGLVVARPSAAAASETGLAAGTYTFVTTLTPQFYGAGAYEGVLRLTVASDGGISGYFRNDDAGSVREVVGGVTGNRIWLDLEGSPASAPINGTVENGKILGGLYDGHQPFEFVATPDAHVAI